MVTKLVLLLRILPMMLLVASVTTNAQIDSAAVQRDVRKAVDLMDRNLPDEAITYWDKAITAMPDFAPYRYERALCHVMAKRYEAAIGVLTPIYTDTNLFDRGYQLLGNCYDYLEDTSRSREIYEAGLAAWPTSGRLHYELGAAAYLKQDVTSALNWWVKGTKVEPTFATNYYWICKGLAPTKDKLWAVLYGELFLNLEPNTERTQEISSLLFATWNKAISLGHPDDPINFCSEKTLNEPSPYGPATMNFPMAFEFTVATSSQMFIPTEGVKERLSIKELVDIRVTFIRGWMSGEYAKRYPNDLLAFHAKLLEDGWLDEYFWWLFGHGDLDEMRQHYRENANRYDTFLAYFGTTPGLDFSTPLCVGIGCDKR